jgi:hypothetical protein
MRSLRASRGFVFFHQNYLFVQGVLRFHRGSFGLMKGGSIISIQIQIQIQRLLHCTMRSQGVSGFLSGLLLPGDFPDLAKFLKLFREGFTILKIQDRGLFPPFFFCSSTAE